MEMLDRKPPRKDDVLMIRINKSDKKVIKALAGASGLTISEYFLNKLYENLTDKEKAIIELVRQQENIIN